MWNFFISLVQKTVNLNPVGLFWHFLCLEAKFRKALICAKLLEKEWQIIIIRQDSNRRWNSLISSGQFSSSSSRQTSNSSIITAVAPKTCKYLPNSLNFSFPLPLYSPSLTLPAWLMVHTSSVDDGCYLVVLPPTNWSWWWWF